MSVPDDKNLLKIPLTPSMREYISLNGKQMLAQLRDNKPQTNRIGYSTQMSGYEISISLDFRNGTIVADFQAVSRREQQVAYQASVNIYCMEIDGEADRPFEDCMSSRMGADGILSLTPPSKESKPTKKTQKSAMAMAG